MTANVAITRPVTDADQPAISALHARVFGPGRFARSAYRVREGTVFASPFCRLAILEGSLIAALRLTPVTIGGAKGALLLGPLAVDPMHANKGYGRQLTAEGFAAAAVAGFKLVVLVGNLSYYSRMEFVVAPRGQIWLPGPADPARILVRELVAGSVAQFKGVVVADPAFRK